MTHRCTCQGSPPARRRHPGPGTSQAGVGVPLPALAKPGRWWSVSPARPNRGGADANQDSRHEGAYSTMLMARAKDVDTGCLVPGPAAVLPQLPPFPAQPARRAPGQEPARTDNRPRPSALADPAGTRTASAPAALTMGRPAASRKGHPSSRNPALTVRRSSVCPCDPKMTHSEPRPTKRSNQQNRPLSHLP